MWANTNLDDNEKQKGTRGRLLEQMARELDNRIKELIGEEHEGEGGVDQLDTPFFRAARLQEIDDGGASVVEVIDRYGDIDQ